MIQLTNLQHHPPTHTPTKDKADAEYKVYKHFFADEPPRHLESVTSSVRSLKFKRWTDPLEHSLSRGAEKSARKKLWRITNR